MVFDLGQFNYFRLAGGSLVRQIHKKILADFDQKYKIIPIKDGEMLDNKGNK